MTITKPPVIGGTHKMRSWLLPTGAVIAVIVAAVVAVPIGYKNGASAQQRADQPKIAVLRSAGRQMSSTIVSLKAQLSTASARAHEARQQANQAQQKANAQAKAKYAAKMTAASRAESQARADVRGVATKLGQLNASRINADGVYVVSKDIRAGTWHTPGDGGAGGDQCYYAVLNSTNTEDIADNNNFDGPETVTLGGAAFEISGGCPWYRVG